MEDEAEVEDFTFDYDGENFTMELDGEELIGCQWLPASRRPRFLILFFHGLGAFLAVNRPYFPEILRHDGAVFGTDHLGHGRSPGERGYVTHESLFKEIRLLIARAKAVFPDLPLFIYGHSLGGLTTLSFVCQFPDECNCFDGVIIECPWLYETDANEASIAMRLLGKVGRFILPTTPISTGSGFEGTQYPQGFIDEFLKSNLGHDYITPRLYASVVEMRPSIRENPLERWPSRLPLLFMQGGKDGSVGVDRNMKWAERLREGFPGKVRILFSDESEHAMLRGTEGNLVLHGIINFIEACLEPRDTFRK
jgi:alpha-beta hydrolase superfamily lysophospholipase